MVTNLRVASIACANAWRASGRRPPNPFTRPRPRAENAIASGFPERSAAIVAVARRDAAAA